MEGESPTSPPPAVVGVDVDVKVPLLLLPVLLDPTLTMPTPPLEVAIPLLNIPSSIFIIAKTWRWHNEEKKEEG